MAKPTRNTYGRLSSELHSLGFKSVRYGTNIVFTHASGRPLILLPSYKSGQAVKPIHLMMVKKQLTDAGMIKSATSGFRAQTKPTPKGRAIAKSPIKIES